MRVVLNHNQKLRGKFGLLFLKNLDTCTNFTLESHIMARANTRQFAIRKGMNGPKVQLRESLNNFG